MKKLILAIFAISITYLQSYAQSPQLVDDITPGAGSTSFSESIACNGKLIFTAGSQLWISDGTTSGTQLLKNFPVNANGSSVPAGFKVLNNKVYFVVNDSLHGNELWASDGTASGTQMVIDINTGPGVGSIPVSYNDYYLTVMNNKLFFAANDGVHGTELWVSDGTAANTQMIKDINTTPDSGSINSPVILNAAIAAINNQVLFAANDGVHGTELWTTDGTDAGTVMVQDIVLGATGSSPQYFMPFNDKVIFSTTGGVYISDGTSAGTFEIIDGLQNFLDYAMLNNNYYFCTASYYGGGTFLWVSDGTQGGTQVIKDSIFNNSQIPNEDIHHRQIYLTAFNNKLYFSGQVENPLPARSTLWQSDGTPAGTSILKTFALASEPYVTQLLPVGGNLYFKSFDTSKVNVWYFDGTDSNGIFQVGYPGSNVTSTFTITADKLLASPFTLVNDNLFFAGYYDNTLGTELYKLAVNPNGVEFVSPNENTLKIYPNPSSNILFVDAENVQLVCIYNICGVLQQTYRPENSIVTQLNISSLPPGVYTVVSLSAPGSKQFAKFVKD